MKVGYHTSIKEINHKDDFDIRQVFISNPRSREFELLENKYNSYKVAEIQKYLNEVGTLVVHAPYVLSMYNPETRRFTLKWVKDFIEYISSFENYKGNVKLVIHTNKPGSYLYSDPVEKYLMNTMMFMSDLSKEGIDICIETDASPKAKGADVQSLVRIIRESNLNLGVCLDTEHSYANGTSFDKVLESLQYDSDLIKVIHFNPIPEYVGFGSGLDRHNDVDIRDCPEKERLLFIWSLLCKPLYENTPVILERSYVPYEDLKWLNTAIYFRR